MGNIELNCAVLTLSVMFVKNYFAPLLRINTYYCGVLCVCSSPLTRCKLTVSFCESLSFVKKYQETFSFNSIFFTLDVHNIQLKPGTAYIKIITEGCVVHYEASPFFFFFFLIQPIHNPEAERSHNKDLICLNKITFLQNTTLVYSQRSAWGKQRK